MIQQCNIDACISSARMSEGLDLTVEVLGTRLGFASEPVPEGYVVVYYRPATFTPLAKGQIKRVLYYTPGVDHGTK